MQNQQKNNLCSKFIKNSLSENYCDNCGREEWYHPKENDYKIIFYNEGIKKSSQHNFNKSEIGNAIDLILQEIKEQSTKIYDEVFKDFKGDYRKEYKELRTISEKRIEEVSNEIRNKHFNLLEKSSLKTDL